jgi:phosphatidylglycerophosphate synthase
VGCFYWGGQFRFLLWLNPLVILVRFVMNALDGLLARRQNTASSAGEVMNELSDVVGDTVCYGILYFLFPKQHLQVVGLLLSIWFCEYVAVLGKSLPGGVRRQESVGGGKPERAVWLGLLSLAWACNEEFVRLHMGLYLGLVTALIVLSGLKRIQKSLQVARGREYASTTLYGK